MSREQTPDAVLLSGLLKDTNKLPQLVELFNKTDKSLKHYNGKGVTAFLTAVGLRKHEFIAYLFSKYPEKVKDWLSQFSTSGKSALHFLSERGFDQDGLITAKLLLDHGASIDVLSKDSSPVTPLYLATVSRNSNIVPLYIEYGANVLFSGKPPHNQTPIELSCVIHQNHADNISQAKMRESFLFAACKIGDALAVESLLAAGTNINARNKNDDTPLHIAAACKHLKCVEVLLANSTKPDVNAVDKTGFTPLTCILFNKPHDDTDVIAIIRLLIQNRANLFFIVKMDDREYRCIDLIAKFCKRDVFDIIPQSVIKEYRQDNTGYTLLHLAVLADNLGTSKKSGPIGLLKEILGIDVRANGKTPLELITANGTAECASVLLFFGANPLAEAPGKKGIHAYAYAKYTDNDNPERAEILKLIEDKLGIKHEKENVNQPATKPVASNNLHIPLPTAPVCKAVGKTPTLYQPLPAAKDNDIYVSSRFRAGQSAADAAGPLPIDKHSVITGDQTNNQKPK